VGKGVLIRVAVVDSGIELISIADLDPGWRESGDKRDRERITNVQLGFHGRFEVKTRNGAVTTAATPNQTHSFGVVLGMNGGVFCQTEKKLCRLDLLCRGVACIRNQAGLPGLGNVQNVLIQRGDQLCRVGAGIVIADCPL